MEVSKADFDFSSKLYEALSRNDKSSVYYKSFIINSLRRAGNHFQESFVSWDMTKEKIINLLLVDGMLKYTRWCKMNLDSVFQAYQRFGLGNYCYRPFYDITMEEKEELLEYSGIKLHSGDKILLNDPFEEKIFVDREKEDEVVQREWVHEKRVPEWDGLDWSSYLIPGHWDEKKEKRVYHHKEEISQEQLVLARKYCLTKRIFPKSLIKEEL